MSPLDRLDNARNYRTKVRETPSYAHKVQVVGTTNCGISVGFIMALRCRRLPSTIAFLMVDPSSSVEHRSDPTFERMAVVVHSDKIRIVRALD